MNIGVLDGLPSEVLVLAGTVLFVFAALTVWWVYQERSARGVQRRARDTGKQTAAGVGFGLASAIGALAGFGSGLSAAVGSIGNQLSSHAGFVVDLGLSGLGASVVTGAWSPSSVYAFLAACGIIVVFGVMWRGK